MLSAKRITSTMLHDSAGHWREKVKERSRGQGNPLSMRQAPPCHVKSFRSPSATYGTDNDMRLIFLNDRIVPLRTPVSLFPVEKAID